MCFCGREIEDIVDFEVFFFSFISELFDLRCFFSDEFFVNKVEDLCLRLLFFFCRCLFFFINFVIWILRLFIMVFFLLCVVCVVIWFFNFLRGKYLINYVCVCIIFF